MKEILNAFANWMETQDPHGRTRKSYSRNTILVYQSVARKLLKGRGLDLSVGTDVAGRKLFMEFLAQHCVMPEPVEEDNRVKPTFVADPYTCPVPTFALSA